MYGIERLERADAHLGVALTVVAGGARRWHLLAGSWLVSGGIAAGGAWLVGLIVPAWLAIALGLAAGGVTGPVAAKWWVHWRARRGEALLTGLRPASGPALSRTSETKAKLLAHALLMVSAARTTGESSRLSAAPVPRTEWWGMGRVAYQLRLAWRAVAQAQHDMAMRTAMGSQVTEILPPQMYTFDVDAPDAAVLVDGQADALDPVLGELERRGSGAGLAAAISGVISAQEILQATATNLGANRSAIPVAMGRGITAIATMTAGIATILTAGLLAGLPVPVATGVSLALALVLADTVDWVITRADAARQPLTRAVAAARPRPIGIAEANATVAVWRDEVAARMTDLKALADRLAADYPDADWQSVVAANIEVATEWLSAAHQELTDWRI